MLVQPLAPARKWTEITAGAGDLAIPGLKGLWVNQACTITVTDAAGTSLVFTVAAAGPVDIVPVKLTAISVGTVYGLHD